jgi:hypothetical protein
MNTLLIVLLIIIASLLFIFTFLFFIFFLVSFSFFDYAKHVLQEILISIKNFTNKHFRG